MNIKLQGPFETFCVHLSHYFQKISAAGLNFVYPTPIVSSNPNVLGGLSIEILQRRGIIPMKILE